VPVNGVTLKVQVVKFNKLLGDKAFKLHNGGSGSGSCNMAYQTK
jgi:hypothetical protein